MQGLPQTKAPLVKLLVEGFHSPTACIRLVEWRDRKSIVTDPHNQPINFSSPACPCQRAGSEMQSCPPKGPLVKLLVEGSIACTACIRLVEWRDRKSIVTLTRTTNPSIFSSPACPHVRGPGEMQGAPGTQGPSSQLVEGFHSPCTACIRLVEWRDRKSIVTLTRTTNSFSSPHCPACQRPG
jgi:hypothetical protein